MFNITKSWSYYLIIPRFSSFMTGFLNSKLVITNFVSVKLVDLKPLKVLELS